MLYLLQVTVYTALLYAIYLAVIKDRAAHHLSRAYLLACAALPLVIPFIHITALNSVSPIASGISRILLPEITVSALSNSETNSVWKIEYILMTTYTLIVLALLTRTSIQYFFFRRFVKKHDHKTIDGIKVLTDTHVGPGSFSDYIFLPGGTIDPVIYEHELAHIRLRHSADILLMRILQACFWPNVILYAITKELKVIHEYQADACSATNKEDYISVLLNDTFNTGCFSLAHTFFYHPLKRRIFMLQKTPQSRTTLRMTMLKTGFSAAVVLSGIVYLQSCKPEPVKQNVSAITKTVYDTFNVSQNTGHREVLEIVEKMPHADFDVNKFMSEHLEYPDEAKRKGIQGKVIIKFVVNEDGTIGPDFTIVRSPDSLLTMAAVSAMIQMPAWQPAEQSGKKVAVYMYQPISFQL